MEAKHVLVIAGPAGSGKDSIARELLKRSPNFTLMVTATTRAMRPGEEEGKNYYFFTNERFQRELKAGNILEHYYREDTDTYYGTYKPDIEGKLKAGKNVIAVVQIVGAKFLKQHYGATTIFVVPPSLDALERRIRNRAPVSDIEWQERLAYTERELADEAPWYDHRVVNEDGKLMEAVDSVVAILQKEGYDLGI